LHGDEATQVGLAMVALAHAPRARSVAVVGQGSGMTTEMLLGSSRVERVVTVEIEPEVIPASRRFMPANHRVFDDPRSSIVLDDARAYLSAGSRRWDLIVSEPSNPCVSGVAGLFSTEFYGLVARHLAADGVLVQWLHVYELDDDLVLAVLGAVQEHFHDYEVFLLDADDMAIVATNAPHGLEPDWSVAGQPGLVEDLHHVPPYTPDVFEAMRVGGRSVLGPLVTRTGFVNSDFRPRLDLGAERARFLFDRARGFVELNADRFALPTVLPRRRLDFAATPFVPTADLPRWRARALGAALRHDLSPVGLYEADMRTAYQRRDRIAATLRSGVAPADWRVWLSDVLAFEQDLHGGTAGVVDEGFYAPLFAYARRDGAPDSALTSLAFAHDLARWDFVSARAHADTLTRYAEAGLDWTDPGQLLDGALAAQLALGDRDGAARSAVRLAAHSGRAPGDLRMRLLDALVGTTERGSGRSSRR
jgi:hypothetical protein